MISIKQLSQDLAQAENSWIQHYHCRFYKRKENPEAYYSTCHASTLHVRHAKAREMLSTLQSISEEPLFPGKMLGHFFFFFLATSFNTPGRAVVEVPVLGLPTPESTSFHLLTPGWWWNLCSSSKMHPFSHLHLIFVFWLYNALYLILLVIYFKAFHCTVPKFQWGQVVFESSLKSSKSI